MIAPYAVAVAATPDVATLPAAGLDANDRETRHAALAGVFMVSLLLNGL